MINYGQSRSININGASSGVYRPQTNYNGNAQNMTGYSNSVLGSVRALHTNSMPERVTYIKVIVNVPTADVGEIKIGNSIYTSKDRVNAADKNQYFREKAFANYVSQKSYTSSTSNNTHRFLGIIYLVDKISNHFINNTNKNGNHTFKLSVAIHGRVQINKNDISFEKDDQMNVKMTNISGVYRGLNHQMHDIFLLNKRKGI